MSNVIDIHDLPEEQVKLVEKFVEFLRKEFNTEKLNIEEKQKEEDWAKLSISSFAEDWDNEKDAVYDNWREHYHVSKG